MNPGRFHTKRIKIVLIVISLVQCLLFERVIFASEVVMKTGDRFQTSKVWEENGKIHFNMQGLMVSVDKADVADIIQGDAYDIQEPPSLSQPMDSDTNVADYPSTVENFSTPMDRKYESRPDGADLSPGHGRRHEQVPGAALDQGTGFKGIEWQMSPKQITGMTKVETDPAFGGIDQYWRPDQSLQWGRVDLDGRVYGFWRDRLYSILMWTNGRGAYEQLRKEAFSIFGPGTQNGEKKERYIWIEAGTQRMLEFDSQLNVGILIMRSSILDAQIKQLYPTD